MAREAEVAVNVTGDASGLKRAMADGESAIGGFASGMGRLAGGIGNAIIGVGQAALKVGGLAASGLAAVGAFGIKVASDMQQSEIAFGTMLGSAEKAKAFLGDLKDFAAATPFELPGLINASRSLLAMGFAAEEVKPTLTAVGDVVAALGLGQEGIDRVARALGQMRAKGKVSAEEMLQLAEAGIPAWDLLAQATGHTVAEVQDLASKGDIAADVFVGAFTRMEGPLAKLRGGMEAQSKSFAGMMSTLKDTVSQGFGEAMRGTVESVSKAMPNIIGQVDKAIKQIGPALGTFFNQLIDVAQKLLPLLGPALAGVARIAGNALGAVAKAIGRITENIEYLAKDSQYGAKRMFELGMAGEGVEEDMNSLDIAILAVGRAAGALGRVFQWFKGRIQAVADTINYLVETSEYGLRGAFEVGLKGGGLEEDMNELDAVMVGLGATMRVIGAGVDWLRGRFDQIRGAVQTLIDTSKYGLYQAFYIGFTGGPAETDMNNLDRTMVMLGQGIRGLNEAFRSVKAAFEYGPVAAFQLGFSGGPMFEDLSTADRLFYGLGETIRNFGEGALKVIRYLADTFGGTFKPNAEGAEKAGTLLGKALQFIADHADKIIPIAAAAVVAFLGFKAVLGPLGGVKTLLAGIELVTSSLKLATAGLNIVYAALNLLTARIIVTNQAAVGSNVELALSQGALSATTKARILDIEGLSLATIGYQIATWASTAATWALNTAIAVLTSPITLIIAAVVAVVAALILAYKHSDRFRAIVDAVGRAIKTGFLAAVHFVVGAWNAAWDRLSAIWEGIKGAAVGAFTAVVGFFATLPARIGAIIDSIVAWFQNLPNALRTLFFETIPYYLGYAAGTIAEWEVKIYRMFVDGLMAIYNFFTETLPRWASNFIDWVARTLIAVGRWFQELPGRVAAWVSDTYHAIIEWSARTYVDFVAWVGRTIDAVIEWFRGLPARIAEWMRNAWQRVVDFAKDFLQAAKDVGKAMVDGVVEFVTSIPEKVKEAFGNAVQAVKDTIGSAWQAAKDWGGNFTKGFDDGVQKHSPTAIEKTVMGMRDTFHDVMGGLAGDAGPMGRSVGAALTRGFVKTMAVTDALGDLAPAVSASINRAELAPAGMVPRTVAPAAAATAPPVVYNIYVTAGMGADGGLIGAELVSALKEYERRNGDGWRS